MEAKVSTELALVLPLTVVYILCPFRGQSAYAGEDQS